MKRKKTVKEVLNERWEKYNGKKYWTKEKKTSVEQIIRK